MNSKVILRNLLVFILVAFILTSTASSEKHNNFKSYLKKGNENQFYLVVEGKKVLEIVCTRIDLSKSYEVNKFSSKIALQELGECYAVVFNFSGAKIVHLAIGAKEEEVKIENEGIEINFFDIKEQLGYKYEENKLYILVKSVGCVRLKLIDKKGNIEKYFLKWDFDRNRNWKCSNELLTLKSVSDPWWEYYQGVQGGFD